MVIPKEEVEKMVVETIIVGGSAAGLAVGACLKKKQRRGKQPSFIILEKEPKDVGVAVSWKNHYDRLRLHSDRRHSGLPHLPMSSSKYSKYPTKNQVISYMEDYAKHFDLVPRFGQQVKSIERYNDDDDDSTSSSPSKLYRWRVTTTTNQVYVTSNVVIATGNARIPHRPTPPWPGQDKYEGQIIHTSSYKNGKPFVGKRVIVVGFGNSAGEIAVDLVEHGAGEVSMSVRDAVNVIPRDILGISILAVGTFMSYLPPWFADLLAIPLLWLTIGNLSKYGLRSLPYGPNVQIRKYSKVPMIDVGVLETIKRGKINVLPGIKSFRGGKSIEFVDGTNKEFDLVILGTGYKPAVNEFLHVPLTVNSDGSPLESGCEIIPGLYFCGFYVSQIGMLQQINVEAEQISASIAK